MAAGTGVAAENGASAAEMARQARQASRDVETLDSGKREMALRRMADALLENQDDILVANAEDVKEAKEEGLSAPLLKRLELSKSKLEKLANGIRKIAEQEEPLGKPRRRVEVAQGMQLEQVTCALGVILVIFESRPDALPQIASLALRAGCGVILKGGKEAKRSNTLLHSVCSSAASEHVSRGLIHLVQDREAVSELLGMDGKIDLVVPRGGPDLVKSITQQTSLPVLGHSDGICHLYLHSDCDPDMAKRLAVDSKCDYPAACNAMETLLVHEHLVRSGVAQSVVEDLKANGVALNGGQKAMEALGIDRPVSSFSFEYGDKECAVEVVTSLQEAISFINRHGSSHTDAIVATDERDQKEFLSKVDSACVFANCSTRFSDGYRFGLGAEVGISTGRIHARGPVGVEGLLSTKWIIHGSGQAVDGDRHITYTHKPISI